MVDKLNIIEDIESEYKKLYNECKKKYVLIKDLIEANLQTLNDLKNFKVNQIEHELKKSVEGLLKPITQATESKYSKLYISCLCIAKKLVTHNLVRQNQTGTVIKILKDILDNSNEDFIQIKVLETLLPMVNPQVINLTEDLVNNVLQMCFKLYSFKNNNYKNPVSALFKQLMITVFGFLDGYLRPIITNKIEENKKGKNHNQLVKDHIDQKVEEIIESENITNEIEQSNENKTDLEKPKEIEHPVDEVKIICNLRDVYDYRNIDLTEFFNVEVYNTSISVFKTLMLVLEGKKKDWILPNLYSKALAIELLSGIIEQSGYVILFIEELNISITQELIKLLHKTFETANDYITGMKLCRLSIQIIDKMHIGYELIPFILKYAESTQNWQKYLGIECLISLCSNPEVIIDLYQLSLNITSPLTYYSDLIDTLTKVSYSTITNKIDLKAKNINIKSGSFCQSNYVHPPQKLINTASILTETDYAINIQTSYPNPNIIQKLAYESFIGLKYSFFKIATLQNIEHNKINTIITDKQIMAKELIILKYETIKNSMTALLINTTDEAHCQGYLNLFLSYISLFGCIQFYYGRDSYLNDLCKLAIPNNLENSLEMRDKNLLITKAVLNIVHCTHILDFNAWCLILDTLQKIYLMLLNSNNHMLKPSQEFEIDVIIKNLENTIKKFDPEYGSNQERTVLRVDMDDAQHINTIKPSNEIMTKRSTNEINEIISKDDTKSQSSQIQGGLLSSIKNAFTFTTNVAPSKENHTNQNNQSIKDDNVDLMILSTAIDSLFINSKSYDIKLLIDIVRAFSHNTEQLIEDNPSMGENIITYLHFNLTKILEICVINISKVPFFWSYVLNLINIIAAKNFSNISRFSMDCLTIINMFMLTQFNQKHFNEIYSKSKNEIQDYYKNEQEKIIEINQFESNWQGIIFKPFITITDSLSHMNIFLNMVYNLGKILQNCGQYFDKEGWEFYFKALSILVIKADENLAEQSFKLVETINAEFIDFLQIENIKSYSILLENFSLNKKNANISYLAVTMFWSCCKVIEKFNKLYKKLITLDIPLDKNGQYDIKVIKTSSSELYFDFKNLSINQLKFFAELKSDQYQNYFDTEWKGIFSKMISVNTDSRFEVRRACISTFADMFNNYCFIINQDVSKFIIEEIYFLVFSKAYSNFETKIKRNRLKAESKETNKDKKSNLVSSDNLQIGDFKADSLKLPNQTQTKQENLRRIMPTQDEKEWEESMILISQSIGKAMKVFLINQRKNNIDDSKINESLFNVIVTNYCLAMKMTSPDLASALLKSLQEIHSANQELFYKNYALIWTVFEEMGKFIITEFYLTQICSLSSGSKMIHNVLDILKEIFIKNQTIYNVFTDGKNLAKLLNYVSLLLKSTRTSEGIMTVNNPQKHLIDEKYIFDFIEQLHLQINSLIACNIYHNYLLQFVKYDLSDLHSEAHCRRVLEIMETFYTSKLQDPKINLKELVLQLIQETSYLCCLRNKNEYVTVLIKNNKLPMQLWHFTVYQLIKVLKITICEERKQTDNNIEEIKTTNNNEVWEALITCFENLFKQSEGGYKNITRTLVDELLKSCQEMEVLVINFIVKDLLPHSLKIPKEKQIKLLNLLDLGCNFDYNSTNVSNSSSASISKVCMANLFDLCKYRSIEDLKNDVKENQESYYKIKVKIAKMSTPILLRRCKEILKSYFDDEVKSGSMPLPKTRIEDVKYVLESLKVLEVYSDYHILEEEIEQKEELTLKDLIMKNKKSHLFTLMPFFSEFITSKEPEIKSITKEILKIISQQIEK